MYINYAISASSGFRCAGTTKQFVLIQDARLKSKDAQSCLARLAMICCSVLKQASHLLSDRCCAGNPLWQAPVCYKWADTLRDGAKAKNFTISSDACATDRKMRMTPPRSFSLSPCDAHSRCTGRACTTRHLTVTGSFLTRFKMYRIYSYVPGACTQTHSACRKTLSPLLLFVQMCGYTRMHPSVQLANKHANKM